MYSHGRPRIGRDSILLKLMSRRAKTLRDLKSAPGRFLTLNAIEVLLAPGGMRRRKLGSEAALFFFRTAFCIAAIPAFPVDLRIRKKRVKFRLSSSMPACSIFP